MREDLHMKVRRLIKECTEKAERCPACESGTLIPGRLCFSEQHYEMARWVETLTAMLEEADG